MSVAAAIVFDLDWTLYDADAFYDEAWRRVACHVADRTDRRAETLNEALQEVWRDAGPSCPNLFDRWLHRTGLPRDPWVDAAVAVLHGDWNVALTPYPGVGKLLRELSALPLGLLTEGRSATQRRKLRALELETCFDAIVISEAVGAAKSTGRPYLEICRRLDVDPKHTLTVGDRFDSDLAPAAAHGASTCRVRRGPFAEEPSPYRADWQIDTIDALPAVIQEWQGSLHR